MPLLKDYYTAEDYWNLPEGERAELIDGKFYDMAPPSRIHQKLVSGLHFVIRKYISDHHGSCEVYPAPFAVNLDADDKDWVEPDVSGNVEEGAQLWVLKCFLCDLAGLIV